MYRRVLVPRLLFAVPGRLGFRLSLVSLGMPARKGAYYCCFCHCSCRLLLLLLLLLLLF